jgi:diaminopimelate epimerase
MTARTTAPTLYKMTGSGNDFVFLDGRETALADWSTERIVAVCDRRTGVGADGLVLLEPEGPEQVRMHFYNSDGSRAAMCGNAALCSTRLSHHLGFLTANATMTLQTDAGGVRARCTSAPDGAEINLPACPMPVGVAEIVPIEGESWVRFTTVGVPHLVVFVDDLEQIDLPRRGRELRYHAALGSAGANVNFVAQPALGAPWPIRTYERGVEGETLACGTGTVAAAIAITAMTDGTFPMAFISRGGFPLTVRATTSGDLARDVWLEGQGRLVFTAHLDT